ncbi:MAG: ABC transporter ATP-binding protein [Patescibacteria group bacterium]
MNHSHTEYYSNKQLLADMWSFIRPYRGKFWLATLLRFSSDLVWLYPAWALGQITTFFVHYTRGQSLRYFWILLALWIAAGLYRFIIHEVAKYHGYQVAERIGLDAKLKTIQHLFSLDLRWHEKMRSGAKLKRVARGGDGLQHILRIYYTNIIESVLNIIAVGFILKSLGVGFSIAFVLFVATYYFFSYVQTKRAEYQSVLVDQREEEVDGVLFESINNILTVKTMGFSRALEAYISKSMNGLMAEIRKRIVFFRVREGSLNIYTIFARLAGFVFIGYGMYQGRFEVGLLIMFNGYFDLVWRATAELAEVTNDIAVDKVAVGRMKELLQVQPTIEGVGKLPFSPAWHTMQMKEVSFAYRQRKVLNDISLTIARGEKVGIVGFSGAGKSTLFKILLKLYEDYSGEITIDGVSLRDIERDSYIHKIAVVMQDTELFDLSLKDNIAIVAGEKEADEAALKKALMIAHLDEMLPQLPQGVDTLIGEKGVRLSGGEKQRLGIARAVYKNPEILFLDEATSHLDADSERKIQDSLHQFFQHVTAIVIAHRLSTIKEMDRIVVLEKGSIVEQGTFAALLRKKGIFYQLWEKQKL